MASELPQDTVTPPPSGGMIGRIQRLLLTPKEEWPRIEAEPMTVQGIVTGWVVPLAAIGPIAGLIGGQLFPYTVPILNISFRPPIVGAIVLAVLGWALAVGLNYVWSLIIDALAPSFGGTKNPISALKTAAFSATAIWVCAILSLLPALAAIGALLGLYSVYLFWIGGPLLMKIPADKAPGFVVVSIIVGIVANLIAGVIAFSIVGSMFAMTPSASTILGATLR